MKVLTHILDPRQKKDKYLRRQNGVPIRVSSNLCISTNSPFLIDSSAFPLSMLSRFHSENILLLANLNETKCSQAERILKIHSISKKCYIALLPYSQLVVDRLALTFELLRSHEDWFFGSFRNDVKLEVFEFMMRESGSEDELFENSKLWDFMLYCGLDMRTLSIDAYHERDFDEVIDYFHKLTEQFLPD
jgi:hypothetical protein